MSKSIVIGSILLAASLAGTAPTPNIRVAAAWENVKAMAGEWSGAATDGRKIHHRAQLIAAGSVLMEESWFEGHKGEMMVTMYHLDGDKLMLTHYCVAKNQPRMQATEISEDGKRVLFTFVDGGNIPSRDKGHMDKALYVFKEKDRFSSQWTWYAAGKEQWMEEFNFARTSSGAAGAASTKAGSGGSCCPSDPRS